LGHQHRCGPATVAIDVRWTAVADRHPATTYGWVGHLASGEGPGALVVAAPPAGEPAGGPLMVPGCAVQPVPAGLDPALACLAAPLAGALAAVSAAPPGPGEAWLHGYDLAAALTHQVLARQLPAIEVHVVEHRRVPRLVAAAFDGRLHAADPDAAVPPAPPAVPAAAAHPFLADAVAFVSAESWRFRPLVTRSFSAAEAKARTDADEGLAAVVLS